MRVRLKSADRLQKIPEHRVFVIPILRQRSSRVDFNIRGPKSLGRRTKFRSQPGDDLLTPFATAQSRIEVAGRRNVPIDQGNLVGTFPRQFLDLDRPTDF